MSVDLSKLKEPFDPFDLEWRVQAAGKTAQGKLWASIVAYVDNRAIQDRLDEICGVDGWKNEFTYPTDKAIICGISIKLTDEWLTKWDGAEETNIEAVKGGLSGSMKRAAVQWGIGRYLYRIPVTYVTPLTNQPKPMDDYIVTQAKIAGAKTRIYFKRPKLPLWALPKEEDGTSSNK